jgi:O-antigen ligase
MHLNKSNNLPIYYLVLILPFSFLVGSFFVNIIAVSISIYTLIWIFKNKNFYILFKTQYVCLFLLFCVFIASTIFSNYKLHSLENSFAYLSNVLLFISLTHLLLQKDNRLLQISKIVFVIVMFLCVDLWIQKFTGTNVFGYVTEQAGRLTSVFKGEQIPGVIIFKLLPFIIFYLFTQKEYKALFNYKYSILILIYFSILITGERAASILSTLLILFLLFLNFKSIDKKKLIGYSMLVAILFSILYNQKNSIIKERIYYTFKQSKDNVYIDLYKNSFEIFRKNIILGTGPQTYRFECPKIKKTCSTHPHNFILELLSDSGILSPILLIVSLLSLVFFKIIKTHNKFLKSLIVTFTILFFFPIIPTGSFFTSYHMTLTWLSLGFLYSIKNI